MDQIQKLLTKLFRQVGSARSKRLLGLVERKEWRLLQQESLAPAGVYQNSYIYRRDAVCVELLRKCLLPSDKGYARAKAVETFWVAEAQCAKTNARLARFESLQGPFEPGDEPVVQFITAWRKNVGRVLGRLPDQLNPRFSGGSTLSDTGVEITIPHKLSSVPTVYPGSEMVFRHSCQSTILDKALLRPVRANRFFTVPKESHKDRGCCVEASGMVILQLDVDRLLKRKYEHRYKVRFERLPEYHRWLAQVASRHGTFATIDLSNASDTVARRLVKLLLPTDWYELLNLLRAKVTDLDGKPVWLEKFSSMGNGFTFMLETIIFRTLAETLGSRCGSVFGDDIVVETEHARSMLAALRFFGFEPNQRKTFCEGPFRESCGGDFFDGEPVRAHYLKELPGEPQHWVALANGLRRADPTLRWTSAAWHFCIDQLPTSWRVRHGDEKLGDFGVYDPQAIPRIDAHGTPFWEGHVAIPRTFELVRKFAHNPDVAIAAAVLGCGPRIALRDQVAGYKRARVIAYGTNWLPA